MASIYGFTLKNRKTFQGLDWQGNQGNLYYNGKKVAWYNDSGNGGSCDIVYYDNSYAPILKETINRYFKERPIITEYGELDGDEDLFMAELLQLMDDEKEYKKAIKKGYSCLVTHTTQKYAYEKISKIKRTIRAVLATAKKQRLIAYNYASAD